MHDVSVPAAVLAGLISFLSPCVLPLVPPYLVYLTGATIEHVANDESAQASRRAVMTSAVMFVLGFSTVFVALGASASLFGGLIPVPGGIGVFEAGLTAGLTAFGVDPAVATAAVLTDRMVTAYIPPVFGYFSINWMTKHDYL